MPSAAASNVNTNHVLGAPLERPVSRSAHCSFGPTQRKSLRPRPGRTAPHLIAAAQPRGLHLSPARAEAGESYQGMDPYERASESSMISPMKTESSRPLSLAIVSNRRDECFWL